MRPLATAAAAALIALPLTIASPVQAGTWTHDDAPNDMMASSSEPVLDPTHTAGDILRVKYAYKKRKLVIKIKVAEIDKKASRSYAAMIQTKGKRFAYRGTLSGTDHGSSSFTNWHSNKDVKCRIKAAELWRTNTFTLPIPAKCLGNPRWVKIDASVSDSRDGNRFYDYAHVDNGGSYFNWSPKIRRR